MNDIWFCNPHNTPTTTLRAEKDKDNYRKENTIPKSVIMEVVKK